MIDLIKTGEKTQTTRVPRKLKKNGEPAYKIGDKVQLYYKSRMRNKCENCIVVSPPNPCGLYNDDIIDYCFHYTNFFGESEIIDIIHYHHSDYKEQYHEVWMGYTLALAGKEDMDAWAIADGFPNGYIQAHDFFKSINPNWADQNLDVIVWSKDQIIARWQK
jgi:hypothetical protein